MGLSVALAVFCALALAGAALSVLTFWYAKSSAGAALRRVAALEEEVQAELREARAQVDMLATEVRDIEVPPAIAAVPAMPRPGLNLTKRAQVLRMHRHGEEPQGIATALELPLAEVELLLKVHRIIISNI